MPAQKIITIFNAHKFVAIIFDTWIRVKYFILIFGSIKMMWKITFMQLRETNVFGNLERGIGIKL
jgi:hypothetical protein